jgi:hypothetical protein
LTFGGKTYLSIAMLLRSFTALRRPTLSGRLGSEFRRALFIQVEPTPNPDSMKFLPAKRVVLDEKLGAGLHFDRTTTPATAGVESKFARRLLKTSAVTSVYLGRDFVSVNKTENASWAVRLRGGSAWDAWALCLLVSAGFVDASFDSVVLSLVRRR